MAGVMNEMRGPVVDLGEVMAAKQAEAAVASGASFVMQVTEATLEDVLVRSMQHPVVLLATSPRANADRLVADLTALANEAAGRYLVGIVDIDAQPRIAQALQVQALPTALGVLGGQVMTLFQGTKDKADLAAVIDQLLQVAAQNGILGHAEPVLPQHDEDAPDPRFAAADAAIDAGDYATARMEFEKVLEGYPNDPEALAGRAQAGLLERTVGAPGFDADTVMQRAAADTTLEAQLAAADVEMVIGQPEAGFSRLVGVVRSAVGADKDAARRRLLELFDTLGNADPLVQRYRRELMSALF